MFRRNLFISRTTGNETLCFLFFRSRVVISKTNRSSEKWSTGGSFWRMSCRVASSSDWHLEHRYLQKDFSQVNPGEPVERFTCYPQLVSRIEEALLCSFRAKHCPFTRLNEHIHAHVIGPTSRLTSISRKSELFSEQAPHRMQVVAYVWVPSNYIILFMRMENP
jgi:hypothetical protein